MIHNNIVVHISMQPRERNCVRVARVQNCIYEIDMTFYTIVLKFIFNLLQTVVYNVKNKCANVQHKFMKFHLVVASVHHVQLPPHKKPSAS